MAMDITIANRRAIITGNTSDTIFSQSLTTLNFAADTAIADNTTVALITVNGTALARATITANTAVLDTNTVECYQYAEKLPTNGSKVAYLVIGEADSIIGVAEVYVQRNMLADITPPTESVPIYPTSQELQAILTTIQQAIDRVGEIENIVEGFDETVQEGIDQINTATTDGVKSINERVEGFGTQVSQAITQVNTTTQQATDTIERETQGSIEDITNVTNSGITSIARETTEATDTITTQTNEFTTQLAVEKQAIADAVEDAETAKDETLEARDEAVIALNNGCVYTPIINSTSGGSIGRIENGEKTIYKTVLDVGAFAYTIVPSVDFDVKENQVIVIWAWLSIMNFTENDPQEIIIPNNVQFIGSTPSFAVGSECMLALMSTDQGATWIANTQWEKQDGVLV